MHLSGSGRALDPELDLERAEAGAPTDPRPSAPVLLHHPELLGRRLHRTAALEALSGFKSKRRFGGAGSVNGVSGSTGVLSSRSR